MVDVTSRFYDLRAGTRWNCRLAVITCEIPYYIRSTRKYKIWYVSGIARQGGTDINPMMSHTAAILVRDSRQSEDFLD
jgi:hypothetical protein